MRKKSNVTKALIITIFCITIAGCPTEQASSTTSSYDYRGDKESFAAFRSKYDKEGWPEPEKIAYFDPDGTEEPVIRYAHWTPTKGNKKGVVVHFNGRTEFIEKNVYTYKDLLDRGYEVWALDWRGQGFSKRQIDEKQKHDIDSFDTYVKDAAYFIDKVTNTKSSNAKKVLLAHSMGGQIALRYLLENPKTFDYAVLSSPLVGLPGDAWYIRAGNWLKKNTFFASSCVISKSPTWTDNFEKDNACSYVNSGPINDDDLDEDQKTKNYSNDLQKVAEIDCLIESSIDANGPENPDLRVACPTTRWLYEAFESTEKVMKEAKKLATPVLIVRALPDTAVDNEAQKKFCGLTENCELVDVTKIGGVQAGHELLIEIEDIRKEFFDHFDTFVSK